MTAADVVLSEGEWADADGEPATERDLAALNFADRQRRDLRAAQDLIRRRAVELEQSRSALQQSVDDARAGGMSWAQVGAVFGVTRQAAWERFAGGDR